MITGLYNNIQKTYLHFKLNLYLFYNILYIRYIFLKGIFLRNLQFNQKVKSIDFPLSSLSIVIIPTMFLRNLFH